MHTQDNLFCSMQDWLRTHSAQTLGYSNATKAHKSKKCFCESASLVEFLDTFSYDLVYSSGEFFLAVAKCAHGDLGVSECELHALLQASLSKLDRLKKLRDARIYVKTNFCIKANTRPLHVLAMAQGSLWLGFTPRYEDAILSLSEILQMTKDMVATHYAKHKGRLNLWGEVLGYYLYYDGKRYEFDTQGSLKDSSHTTPTQGVFSVTLSL